MMDQIDSGRWFMGFLGETSEPGAWVYALVNGQPAGRAACSRRA
jgi:hypothetical protein